MAKTIQATSSKLPPCITIHIPGRDPYHIWNMDEAQLFILELITKFKVFVDDIENREGTPWENPYVSPPPK